MDKVSAQACVKLTLALLVIVYSAFTFISKISAGSGNSGIVSILNSSTSDMQEKVFDDLKQNGLGKGKTDNNVIANGSENSMEAPSSHQFSSKSRLNGSHLQTVNNLKSENGLATQVSLLEIQNQTNTEDRIIGKSQTNFTFLLEMIKLLPEVYLKNITFSRLFFQKQSSRQWMDHTMSNSGLYSTQQQSLLRSVYNGWQQRYPDALIIGCKKCGTTALQQVLSMHSQVAMVPYEVGFFDREKRFEEGLQSYLQEMPLSFVDQVTMEKTPKYWVYESAPSRIYEMNPHIKLILSVREPVSRVISDFYHCIIWKEFGIKKETQFEDYITNNKSEIIKDSDIIIPSYYDEHIQRWLKIFPQSQIHIIQFEEFYSMDYSVFHGIEEFLGINHEINASTLYRDEYGRICQKHTALLGETMCKQPNVHKPRKPDENIVNQLSDLLKPHMEKFYDIVGRDFGWLQ